MIEEGPLLAQTCSVDDALRPAGVAQALKLLCHILYDRRLSIAAIQQALYLHFQHCCPSPVTSYFCVKAVS